MTPRDIQDHLNLLSGIAELIRPDQSVAVPVADPDDAHVIQAAISGRAEIICTRDRHFFAPAVLEFCRNRGIQIMTDLELLRIL